MASDGPDTGTLRRASMALMGLTPQQMPLLMNALHGRARWLPMPASGENLDLEVWQALLKHEPETPVAALDRYCNMRGLSRLDLFGELQYYHLGLSPEWDQASRQEILLGVNATMNFHSKVRASVSERFAYYCGEEVSALVSAGATPDILSVSLTADELPSPSGVAYLGLPEEGPTVLLWNSVENRVGATLFGVDHLRTWLEGDVRGYVEHRHGARPFWPYAEAALSEPGSDDAPTIEATVARATQDGYEYDPIEGLAYLTSLAHMIRQERLIEATEQSVRVPLRESGSSKGRSRKKSRTDLITYLSYTPRPRALLERSTRVTRENRWVVRGHWRRQWYPSLQRHRAIWIMEHIAGPDGAPILVRDKVRIPRPAAADVKGKTDPQV